MQSIELVISSNLPILERCTKKTNKQTWLANFQLSVVKIPEHLVANFMLRQDPTWVAWSEMEMRFSWNKFSLHLNNWRPAKKNKVYGTFRQTTSHNLLGKMITVISFRKKGVKATQIASTVKYAGLQLWYDLQLTGEVVHGFFCIVIHRPAVVTSRAWFSLWCTVSNICNADCILLYASKTYAATCNNSLSIQDLL